MKKIITFLALLMMGVTLAKAQRPYAIWCEDNNTLYFVYTYGNVSKGMSYSFTEDQCVTDYWKNHDVISGGGTCWLSTIQNDLKRVVFDESFKQVKPENTYRWFADCGGLTSIEGLQNLDTSEVTDMRDMFNGCFALTSLDVSKFNTEKVTNMSGMFHACFDLTSLDVSKFNTEQVTNMNDMFCGCSGLTSLDVSKFNTEKVTNMSVMFEDCSGLTTLDISNFKTSALQNSVRMFRNCSNLKTIYCNDTWNVSESRIMFEGCTSLVGGYGKTYSESDIDGRFANPGENGYFTTHNIPYALWCAGNNTLYFVNTKKNITIGSQYDFTENNAVTAMWSGADVTNIGTALPKWGWTVMNDLKKVVFDESFKEVKPISTISWFEWCKGLTSIEGLQNLDTSEVTDMSGMFNNCTNLSSLDVSTFNTAKVEDMSGMFLFCQSLSSLDLSKFNTENVKDMKMMFFYCKSLSSLDVSNFNTEKVTDMTDMFYGCSGLSSLDLSKFNTEKVTNMQEMFVNCRSLTSLDVSNFNTEKVTDMADMFYGCSGLTSLDLSSFNMEKVENTYEMFRGSSNLKTIYCNDTWSVSSSNLMFDGCTSLVGEYGKTYSESDIDCTFANPGENGYFTLTRETLRGTEYNGAYWATYYNGFVKWVADDNTTVYVGRLSADNSELQLTEVTDKTINAGEAVILKSTAAEIKLTGTATVSTYDYTGNSLKGMDRASVVPTDQGTIYTLSIEHGDMAFRQFVGNELGARKAYLAISDASGAPIRIIFGDEATGIADLSTNEIDTKGYYSIDGRYHNGMPTTRGVYIVNGRKVLIK